MGCPYVHSPHHDPYSIMKRKEPHYIIESRETCRRNGKFDKKRGSYCNAEVHATHFSSHWSLLTPPYSLLWWMGIFSAHIFYAVVSILHKASVPGLSMPHPYSLYLEYESIWYPLVKLVPPFISFLTMWQYNPKLFFICATFYDVIQ